MQFKSFFIECSCGSIISKIFSANEPKQHDLLAQSLDSHCDHHDRGQLRALIGGLHHAGGHLGGLLHHVPHPCHSDDKEFS